MKNKHISHAHRGQSTTITTDPRATLRLVKSVLSAFISGAMQLLPEQ